MTGLYIHIPFCEHICHYCDFVKAVPKDENTIDKYIDRLIDEINSYHNYFHKIKTIFIGGGTPSTLNPSQLTKLLSSLTLINPKEFTIEGNPESYTNEKGLIFKQFGINRISLGVQSFKPEILNYINRKHTNQKVFDTINHLTSIGLTNISIDLIFAIPGQTIKDLENDLNIIKTLPIKHISTYSLILEDKTYFYHQYLRGNFTPVGDETQALMYNLIKEELSSIGFQHYEISNFTKPGYESIHNTIYWSLNSYIGVGQGAHGFIDNCRTENERSMYQYLDHFRKEIIPQSLEMLKQDYMIFGLRKIKGVNLEDYLNKFKSDVLTDYPELTNHINNGLVQYTNNNLRLTEKGLLLGNQVFMVFV